MDDILDTAYYISGTTSVDLIPQKLWGKVQKIYDEARTCHDKYTDENAWVDLVRRVLRTAGFSQRGKGFLEINSV